MPTNIRPDADSFERTVENIVRNIHGPRPMATTFLAGSAPLWLHVSPKGIATLRLVAPDAEEFAPEVTVRMVTVQPSGAWGREAVVHDEAGVELGDFRTWRSAVGMALEHACLPNWLAGAQHEHDACAV